MDRLASLFMKRFIQLAEFPFRLVSCTPPGEKTSLLDTRCFDANTATGNVAHFVAVAILYSPVFRRDACES